MGIRARADDLPDYIKTAARPFFSPHTAEPAACGKSVLADAQQLQAALQSHRGNVSAFAKAIGVSRMTVYRYLKKYNLPD